MRRTVPQSTHGWHHLHDPAVAVGGTRGTVRRMQIPFDGSSTAPVISLVGERTHRELVYAQVLEQAGCLTRDLLDAFRPRVEPSLFADLVISRKPAETATEYLLSVGWLATDGDRLAMTTSGRAVLRHLVNVAESADIFVHVADPETRFHYEQLLDQIRTLGADLLVDAYANPADVISLVRHTLVRRVLTKHIPLSAELEAMVNAGELAIRVSSELHDRYLVKGPDVWMLSNSLSGVRKAKGPAALVEMPATAAVALRQWVDAQWGDGKDYLEAVEQKVASQMKQQQKSAG
jgi:hypothetical protein